MTALNKILATLRISIVGLLALALIACDSNGDALELSNLVAVADGGFTSVEISGDTDTVIEVGATTNLLLTAFIEDNPTGTAVNTASVSYTHLTLPTKA